jgi:hypothetical protein
MLRTGQLLHPASHPASQPRTEASLPRTLASPRTGLTPAGCLELHARLHHHNLLVVTAPELLGAPRIGTYALVVLDTQIAGSVLRSGADCGVVLCA